ncbi:MAG: hypothetical protein ABI877_22765, partial [Gemmatimonadaceae bacterium]
DVATPIFELLWSTVGSAPKAAGDEVWTTIQRRFAHCLRAGDQLEAAREILEGLLEVVDDAERAMVLADIALIESGFRRMADLRMPRSDIEREQMTSGLERGRSLFEEAEKLRVTTSSHARYALGMLALLRKDYARSETMLESAVAAFDQKQARYAPSGLLRRAHMNLAIARCANLDSDPNRLAQATSAIVEGLEAGELLPEAFAAEVIAGLTLRATTESQALVEQLLEVAGEPLLDTLRAAPDAHKSPAVADAMRARFGRKRRSSDERVYDGHAALEMLLAQGRFDEAEEVLCTLQAMSLKDIGTQQFSDLLLNGKSLTAVWDKEDIFAARVQSLESIGDYETSAGMLQAEFHMCVAGASPGAYLRAVDAIETLESYPSLHSVDVVALRQRLERSGLVVESLPESPPNRAITVLVLGGGETQAHFDAAIRLHYREVAPWLKVEFLHTGWSSNWAPYLADFRKRVEGADAVVMMYLMRTLFGRSARRYCTKPWRGCGGKGRGSIQRAIDAACVAALSSER